MPSDDRKVPELRAPKQNAALARAAKALASVEGAIDKYAGLPLDIFLPVSSEFLEKLSYGDPFFRQAPAGTGSRIPMTADREYLMEALFGAGTVAPMAQGAARAGRALGQRMQPQADELSSVLDAVEAQRFAKGGRVVDLLAEVLKGSSKAKPKPTKDQPDPGRRAALGLPKDLTPKPGEMVVKEEVKKAPKTGETSVSITEAMNVPMSRRDVLRAGAGQAINAMAPRGALGALAKAATSPVGVAEQAISSGSGAGAPGLSTIPGVIAKAMSMGLDEDQTIALLKQLDLADESDVRYTLPVMSDPLDFSVNIGDEMQHLGPREALGQMIGTGSGLDIRKSLREIARENPDLYEQLKEVARDISDLSMEP